MKLLFCLIYSSLFCAFCETEKHDSSAPLSRCSQLLEYDVPNIKAPLQPIISVPASQIAKEVIEKNPHVFQNSAQQETDKKDLFIFYYQNDNIKNQSFEDIAQQIYSLVEPKHMFQSINLCCENKWKASTKPHTGVNSVAVVLLSPWCHEDALKPERSFVSWPGQIVIEISQES